MIELLAPVLRTDNRYPECGRLTDRYQSLVPLGPEHAECRECRRVWVDQKPVKVDDWNVVYHDA
jgi:hypothetical protein